MRISDWSSDVCSSDLPALVDEATAKAVAASEASGVVGWFDDKASLDTALATLADNVYGVVADETHDDRRYRYRVTDHAIVNGWLDDEGVRLTGNDLKIGSTSCRERVCKYV